MSLDGWVEAAGFIGDGYLIFLLPCPFDWRGRMFFRWFRGS